MADYEEVTDSYKVTASELRQFVERIERLEAEKADIAEQSKEVFSRLRRLPQDIFLNIESSC